MTPKVGFLGLGWIGQHRLRAIAASGAIEVAALADPATDALAAARQIAPHARGCRTLDDLLDAPLDAVVIATPTASHAADARRALQRGAAVFCQKPLATSGQDAEEVVRAARHANRLLGVDLSYRHVRAFEQLRQLVRSGVLGRVLTADLVFHNAYGPDKPWYYDRTRSGGGCLMDLGIHLVDQLVWLFDESEPATVAARLFSGGAPWTGGPAVEDYASVWLQLRNGARAAIDCSWRAPAGADAVISVTVTGSNAAGRVRNVNGSFYDFVAERLDRSSAEVLCGPPDDWGGRAGVEWAVQLGTRPEFDPAADAYVALSRTIDRIYACAAAPCAPGDSAMMRSS